MFRREESLCIPRGFDYGSIAQFSAEEKEKLSRAQPVFQAPLARPPLLVPDDVAPQSTLGAAARIPGVTPASLVILMFALRKRGVLHPAVEPASLFT